VYQGFRKATALKYTQGPVCGYTPQTHTLHSTKMETYHGQVRSPTDAIILFEACRLGMLPRVQRRLSEKERQLIKSGSVFVWDEREAGMRRWTDGKSWSASRVSGSFLTYREMEGKRGGSGFAPVTAARAGRTPDSTRGSDEDTEMAGEEGPDGYRYKPDGLMKQSFSITTSQGAHLHLISYYARSHPTAQTLSQPSTDPNLRHIRPAKGMYPESTVHEQPTVSAVTRGPMGGAPFAISPHMAPPHMGGYPRTGATHPQSYGPPSFPYPPSPLSTPPNHYSHLQYLAQPMPMQQMGGPLPPINQNGAQYVPYNQPHLPPVSQAQQPPQHDRAPPARPPTSESSLPPPPSHYAPSNGVSHGMSPRTTSATLPPLQSTQKLETAPPIDPRLTASLPLPNQSPKANGSSPSIPHKVPSPLREPPIEIKAPNGSSASSYPSVASLINGAAPSETHTETSTTENGNDKAARSSPGADGDGPLKLAPAPKDIPAQKVDNKDGDLNALRKLDGFFHERK
jgi:Gti1/Pac2 family transcription factor